MMAAETWLTAQEALEFGFIDEIVKVGEKNIDMLPLQSSQYGGGVCSRSIYVAKQRYSAR